MTIKYEEYDEQVLKNHSKNMYWNAEITATIYPLLGIAIGASMGYGLFKTLGFVGGSLLGGYAGMRYGSTKATEIRSQAQTALCLTQIEKNTRPTKNYQQTQA